MFFRRILVAVDGTQVSTRGLEVGARWAAEYGVELLVVAVVSVPHHVVKAAGAERGQLDEYVERMGGTALASGLSFLKQERIGAAIKVLAGPVAETIVSEAERAAVDLVVMGRRARTDPQDLFLGTVSDRVVRNVSVPVLLVP
jgi:nucleotide-binding universal stress UspA family protein